MNVKYNLATLLVISLLATGCSRSEQKQAEDHAAAIENALPGSKPGSLPAGCHMRAMIDGKKWEATEMTPDPAHRSIIPVNGKSGSRSIMFTVSGMQEAVGQPSKLSDSNTITYWGGDAFFVGAKSGQVTVTKMDDQFVEGTFNFTAEKDGKKVTCTDGEFRITAPAPASSSRSRANNQNRIVTSHLMWACPSCYN